MNLRALAAAATPGPYYAAGDDASDAPDHHNSGLALVDTGRTADWPIARLQYWHQARFTAFMTPERALAMQDALDAAKAMRAHVLSVAEITGPATYENRAATAFDAALARLEGI